MRRNEDPLLAELRRWGYAHANRYTLSHADRSRHVLENAKDYAPKTVEQAFCELVERDGRQRRRFMAERAGLTSLGEIPAWAVDPVRARNDADRPHDNPEVAVDIGIPDDLRWIDRALASMSRQFPLRVLVVRTEFTVAASQAVKARMVVEQYGGALSVRQYRYELGKAIDWMGGTRVAA
ncbi:hypothetical protein QSH46_013465 [Xanthomonas arboricola pv. juglandis]|uniref:hypothetical protein n=1 Tax=Xanthomonas arboricola TaxID=56448 RepID=UPI00063E83AE|nr:hypothetical protein [Xanthomonas arboricola]MDN0220774.1 hypothetical protein [Xanthomonas arboricola pv. juglandis]MDN0225073.1 hypothetical protein [Xanthomonas arboricola pv. juglandis]MDN0229287.1 hypothetical protein [Xanthomonas arboricola pv. juglandis]MDN0233683.1 hypothetical protein [Xanthomonas arboricola pv. juglandis]MDN0237943.1 hypothetical protein [Xanthomonas arboricola pv. juglandis]